MNAKDMGVLICKLRKKQYDTNGMSRKDTCY